MSCASITYTPTAQKMAEAAASQELNLGDHETRLAMGVIKELVRRMAAMPGQRSIILVSSGFVTLAEHSIDKTDIMDRAIRSSVLINSDRNWSAVSRPCRGNAPSSWCPAGL